MNDHLVGFLLLGWGFSIGAIGGVLGAVAAAQVHPAFTPVGFAVGAGAGFITGWMFGVWLHA